MRRMPRLVAIPAAIRSVISIGALLLLAIPARGQYPGHIDTSKKAAATPRAIAVLEWTGAPGKPSASRLIPISVYDGESYQPGGLYLARPEPLAVQSGTEYILQLAGVPQGLFDVNSARNLEGYWFGYGSWRPTPPPPPVRKLPPAKVMPHELGTDTDDGRPHFKKRTNAGGSDSPAAGQGSQGGDSQKSAGQQPASSEPPPDPDRPTLRRRSSSQPATPAAGSTANTASDERETPVAGSDPDRPRLAYGTNSPVESDFEAPQLAGNPTGMEQMIAVSDATDREPHPFAYSWPDPEAEAKMKSQMEMLAQQALAAQSRPAPATGSAHAKTTAAKPAAKGTAAAHHTRKALPAPPLPSLADESFSAYELTYGGAVTLVFSAQCTDPMGKSRYITLIAQPDFYDVPHVLFQSLTSDDNLDQTPRMQLVDAVDPKADNRGDLLFELRGAHDRQFALYQVTESGVEQVFSTGSLQNPGKSGS